MKLITTKTVLIATALLFALIPKARAAHAAPHLDLLHLSVSNRIADTNEPTTAAQQRALRSADKTLKRKSKTLAADVSLLATAARTLNTRFPSNETFLILELAAIDDYSAEGHALLQLAKDRIGTNVISRGTSNKLAGAEAALDRADQNTNSVWQQARALSSALNRIRSATTPIFRKYTNSVPSGPTAPLTLAGKNVDLTENLPVHDNTMYFLDPYTEGNTGNYTADNPEELGQWTYVRVNDNTGTVLLYPDFPGAAADHQITLTFVTETSGTFVGQDVNGANISGTFSVLD